MLFVLSFEFCIDFFFPGPKCLILIFSRLVIFFQHEAGRAAFEDAQKQMESILGAIETKTASITKIQHDLEKSKLEAVEARKVEQVRVQ